MKKKKLKQKSQNLLRYFNILRGFAIFYRSTSLDIKKGISLNTILSPMEDKHCVYLPST